MTPLIEATTEAAGHPFVTFAAVIVAIVSLIFTAVANRRKSAIDESTLVLGKWKELVDAHESRLKGMDEAFTKYRKQANEEIEALRKRLKEVEDEFHRFRKEAEARVRSRDDEIAGLRRAIAQASQSGAVLLADARPVEETSPTSTRRVRRLRNGDLPKDEN